MDELDDVDFFLFYSFYLEEPNCSLGIRLHITVNAYGDVGFLSHEHRTSIGYRSYHHMATTSYPSLPRGFQIRVI